MCDSLPESDNWNPFSGELFSRRGFLRFRFRNGHGEQRIIQVRVLLDLFYGELLARRTTLLLLLDRKGIVDAVHLLVISVIHRGFLERAANGGLDFDLQLEIGIGVQVVVANVAVLHAELDLVAVGAFHRVMADQFGGVAFFLVVHQRAVYVAVDDEALHVIRRHQVRIFPAVEGRNLPANLAVVRLNLRHTLDDELFSHFARTLGLLTKLREQRTVTELDGGAQGLHGLEFFQAAFRLDIFGDDFVDGLRIRAARNHGYRGNGRQEQLANLEELPASGRTSICVHAFPQNGAK